MFFIIYVFFLHVICMCVCMVFLLCVWFVVGVGRPWAAGRWFAAPAAGVLPSPDGVRGRVSPCGASFFFDAEKETKKALGVGSKWTFGFASVSIVAHPQTPILRGSTEGVARRNGPGAGWPLDTALAAARCRSRYELADEVSYLL